MADKLVETKLLGEQTVEIYERSQMMWLGSFMAPIVVECYYSLPSPNWPKVQIRARRGLSKLWYRLGKRSGIMLDDDAFNASFRVTTKVEEFAIMLLTPELQQFIMEKQNVDWSAGSGSIKLWYRGKLRRKRIDRALNRLERFQSLIAPELFDWE